MQIMDLKGSAYERGLAQGEPNGDAYREMLDTFFTSEMWKENKPKFLPTSLIKVALGLLGTHYTKKAVAKYMPVQAERVRGLGESLSAGAGFIWGVQFMEVMFCEAGSSLVAPSMGCTQVHAAPKATRGNKPLIGRNYDFPNLLRDYQIVRRETPAESDRLAHISVSQIPLAGPHMGMNEAGLVACANNARLWKGDELKYSGLPYQMMILEILETCRTVQEAADYLMNCPERANAGFLGLMDASGDDCVVEFNAARADVRRPNEKGVMAQTNHYHAMPDANLPDGTYWTVKGMEGLEYAKSTKMRFAAADRLLNERAGDIDIDTLKEVLSDHSGNNGIGSDNTVCCHGDAGSTLASMIMDIENRRMLIAEGNPCEGDFIEISFDRIDTGAKQDTAAAK